MDRSRIRYRIENMAEKAPNFLLPSAYRHWSVHPGSVYLVSYPRSGNTWLRYLLANLLEPGNQWHMANIAEIAPDIHEPCPSNWSAQPPVIVKSHKPYRTAYPRVIYIYRDGRDVAVSYYDFRRKLKGYRGDFDAFLEDYLLGRLLYGSWQDHIHSWMFTGRARDVLPICYELMVKDTPSQLAKVANYLNVSWSPEEIEQAISRSTLKKQRTDFQNLMPDTHWNKGYRGGVKGGPGKWRDTFSMAQQALFWQYAGETAEKLGYTQE